MKTNKNGFTLIELLIVSSIFSVILIALSGLFISALKVEKNILETKEFLGQASYAVEYITRALRMAKKDKAGSCINIGRNYEISSGDSRIRFVNSLQGDKCQEFFLSNGQIKYDNGIQITDLTSSDIKIENLKFALSGDVSNDLFQPFLTVYVEARIGKASPVAIQTGVSQRNPDTH